MKKNKAIPFLLGGVLAAFFLSPTLVFAVDPDPVPPPPSSSGVQNPLKDKYSTLDELILGVVGGVAQVGYYLVVIFIVYAGFKFVSARGNEKELGEAKQTFLYTAIGAAILLGATLLANVIKGTINQLETPPPQGSLMIDNPFV